MKIEYETDTGLNDDRFRAYYKLVSADHGVIAEINIPHGRDVEAKATAEFLAAALNMRDEVLYGLNRSSPSFAFA